MEATSSDALVIFCLFSAGGTSPVWLRYYLGTLIKCIYLLFFFVGSRSG